MNHPASRARRDLLLVLALAAVFAALSVHLDLGERLANWNHAHEWLQLDEWPQILLVFIGGLSWFAWRRIQELERELRRRRAAETGLARALEENRRLGRSAAEIEEAERRALAREMHDELGQYLAAIRLDAGAIRADLAAQSGRLFEATQAIVRHVDHMHGCVRAMIGRLRPAALDELGLVAALEDCVQSWRERQPEVEFEFAAEGECDDLGEDLNLVLYRLAQESLTNMARHAAARRMSIRLCGGSPAEGARRVRFEARDDGRGATASPGGRGFGLAGMRERVCALGGSFEAAGGAGGFVVRAVLPRPAAAPARPEPADAP